MARTRLPFPLRSCALAGAFVTLALSGCMSVPGQDRGGFTGLAAAKCPAAESVEPYPPHRTVSLATEREGVVRGTADDHKGPVIRQASADSESAATKAAAEPLGEETPLATPAPSLPDVEDFEAQGKKSELAPREDVKPAIELRGRIQADAILVNQSEKNKEIIGNIQNATGFRRARLGAQGSVGEQVHWIAEFDFAELPTPHAEIWCIFDNTVVGFATDNALYMRRTLVAANIDR